MRCHRSRRPALRSREGQRSEAPSSTSRSASGPPTRLITASVGVQTMVPTGSVPSSTSKRSGLVKRGGSGEGGGGGGGEASDAVPASGGPSEPSRETPPSVHAAAPRRSAEATDQPLKFRGRLIPVRSAARPTHPSGISLRPRWGCGLARRSGSHGRGQPPRLSGLTCGQSSGAGRQEGRVRRR